MRRSFCEDLPAISCIIPGGVSTGYIERKKDSKEGRKENRAKITITVLLCVICGVLFIGIMQFFNGLWYGAAVITLYLLLTPIYIYFI
jgi:CHASE2 domain-containing sensor protein